MALKQMIMSMKPLSASELEKVKASQAIQQAKRKEQEAKRATGADKVEKEVERAVGHADNLGNAQASENVQASLLQQASLPPSLLAKVGRNEKLTTNEQKELANFFRLVGWL